MVDFTTRYGLSQPSFLRLLVVMFTLWALPMGSDAFAQQFTNAKYGSDFLSAGVGARAMAMGQTQTAISEDATSLFWNPAGLMQLDHPDLFLMHSERFSGTIAYDFLGFAWPLNDLKPLQNSTTLEEIEEPKPDAVIAFGVIRQGVDGIQNTLNSWDPGRDRPREDAESFIQEFNVSDLAFYLSYAQPISLKPSTFQLTAGASLKAIHHRLGPFANAWGYGFDVGLQARTQKWRLGLQVTDLLPMLKFWSVDSEELAPLETEYGDLIPSGKNEKVLPALRLGVARTLSFSEIQLLISSDLQFRTENRQAYLMNLGRVSLEPHFGIEGSYRDILYIRAGLTDFILPDGEDLFMTPSIGTGLMLGKLRIDYGFTDFSGYASDLGVTHRISLGYAFR